MSGPTLMFLQLCTRKLGIETRRPVNLNTCVQNDPQLRMRLVTGTQSNTAMLWWDPWCLAPTSSLGRERR